MDNKNFILAFLISFGILYSYQYFFDTDLNSSHAITSKVESPVPNPVDVSKIQAKPLTNTLDITKIKKIEIRSPSLNGYLSTLGSNIEHIVLTHYKQNVNDDELVKVLSKDKYKINMDFVSLEELSLPNENSIWELTDESVLTPSTPVTLKWVNPEGIIFERKISIDNRYLITIVTKIKNGTGKPVSIAPRYSIIKLFDNKANNSWVLNEGAVGYINGSLIEKSFGDMLDKSLTSYNFKNGWMGLTDNYWLVALIPLQKEESKLSLGSVRMNNIEYPELSLIDKAMTITNGDEVIFSMNVFVGAKEVVLLDGYEQSLGIKHFDLAVDYGYLYFVTKPMLYLLLLLNEYSQNMGIAILLITILIKLILFPLANKSYRSMKKMKQIQPKIKQLQAMYEKDKSKLSQEMFALYKKEKVNPAGGCLPMILQIPFMFALYKVITVTIEMRHAPFLWWITDLSAADPTSIFNLFGLLNFDLPSFLKIGAWPIIMGITMYIQQRMTPQVSMDKSQETMMKLLPFIFTYMMSSLSVGLIIYWSFSNILQILQQLVLDRMDASKAKQ